MSEKSLYEQFSFAVTKYKNDENSRKMEEYSKKLEEKFEENFNENGGKFYKNKEVRFVGFKTLSRDAALLWFDNKNLIILNINFLEGNVQRKPLKTRGNLIIIRAIAIIGMLCRSIALLSI